MANDRLSYWAQVLLIIGGLHVGLGPLGIDLLGYLPAGMISTIVDYAVGLSALYVGYNMMSRK
jgi:uncharacterized membrane protein YuzA (DUF378 family)|tara:strand:+ start:101 stop:289 length:189 start_codon:yes stop_codon:yes gene_type:complete